MEPAEPSRLGKPRVKSEMVLVRVITPGNGNCRRVALWDHLIKDAFIILCRL